MELGNLTSLISLDLYQNQFSGIIPASLGYLPSLRFLWVPTRSSSKYELLLNWKLDKINKIRILLSQDHVVFVCRKLNSNKLTGNIPVEVLELVTWGSLRILWVYRSLVTVFHFLIILILKGQKKPFCYDTLNCKIILIIEIMITWNYVNLWLYFYVISLYL